MPPPSTTMKKRGRKKKIKDESDSDTASVRSDFSETTSIASSTGAVPKRPVRSTRSKAVVNSEKKTEKTRRRKKETNSDVIEIPTEPIPCYIVSDSSDSDVPLISRPTRTKEKKNNTKKNQKENQEVVEEKEKSESPVTRKKEKKRQKYFSSEEESTPRAIKRTKNLSKNTKEPEKIPVILENIKQENSVYEDALSETKTVIDTPISCNATYQVLSPQVTQNVTVKVNETVTVSHPVFEPNNTPLNTTIGLLKKNNITSCIVSLGRDTKIEEKLKDQIENVAETSSDLQRKEKLSSPICTVALGRDPVVEGKMKDLSKKIDQTVTSVNVQANEQPSSSENRWEKPQTEVTSEKNNPPDEPALTDDDSIVSPIDKNSKTPTNKPIHDTAEEDSSQEKLLLKKGLKTKPMFSPYANSPVKKRVAAFENKIATATTTRITRTKTKKLMEEKENMAKKQELRTNKVTSKYTTPLSNRFKPVLSNTEGRPILNPTSQNASTISNNSDIQKSQTAVKISRSQAIEKQKLLLEKETEAKLKKQAQLREKADELKRQREEKMQRAKEAREEQERKKQEKIRLQIAEKEEKLREEQEKKKAWLAQKAYEAEEQRRQVEQNRLHKIRLHERLEEEHRLRLLYSEKQGAKAKQALTPLPTADWRDSDSEDERSRRPVVSLPSWTKGK